MSNVRPLPTRATEINEDVSDMLRHWLERAEAGEFSGLVLVATCRDGSISTGSSETSELPRLVGALAIAQHQLIVAANIRAE